MTSAIDYDVHGVAGVRLVGARPSDAAVVDRQLGGLRAPLRRDPDIVVRFVDRLEVSRPVRLLGAGEAGFTDDAFLLLRSRHKARARVRVDVERIGRGGEVVVERGAPAVPLLVAMVNLAALGNGALALHASAFVHGGCGIVATGWSKGGKTEALLAFMQQGARSSATSGSTSRRTATASTACRSRSGSGTGTCASCRRFVAASRGATASCSLPLRVAAGAAGRRAEARRLGRTCSSASCTWTPSRRGCSTPEAIALSAGFDRLFLMRSWEEPGVRVDPVDGAEIAARMAFSVGHERAPLIACYEQFRFAFPDRVNPLLDHAAEREHVLLDRFLAGRAGAHGRPSVSRAPGGAVRRDERTLADRPASRAGPPEHDDDGPCEELQVEHERASPDVLRRRGAGARRTS